MQSNSSFRRQANKYLVPSDMARVFTPSELQDFKVQFGAFDINSDGHIDANELATVMRNLNLSVSSEELTRMIAENDSDHNNTIEFGEFLTIMHSIHSGHASGGLANVVKAATKLFQVAGADANAVHSFSEEEKVAFTTHINRILAGDPHLPYLPLDPESMDLFSAVEDGVLFCKLINAAVPDTVDIRALNIPSRNIYQKIENQNLAINAAKSIGCSVVNVGSQDLIEGQPVLILGIIWQIVRIELLSKISLTAHPELVRLLQEGETLEDLMKLPPDQILLRWVNYHLARSGSPKRITNFGSDVKDSEAYSTLLHQLAPDSCPIIRATDATERARGVIANAKNLDVDAFVAPADIVQGNSKLNLAFVAQLFNACPGLEITEEERVDMASMLDDDEGDNREERVFRMWINSLGLDQYVNSLYGDLRDGVVLLKVMDRVQPGIVQWKKVNLNPRNKFKRTENCNYAVVLGKQMRFSLVNVGGVDIGDGNKKLILAIVWQLMRRYTLNMLAQLGQAQGRDITDDNIIQWANEKVQAEGKTSRMNSFRDPTISTGVFLMDLVAAIQPMAVNWEIVTAGATPDDKANNAKYVISVARKLGAAVFLTFEDIVEVKSKMIMTFVASLWATSLSVRRVEPGAHAE